MLLHGRLPVRDGTVNLGRQSRAPIWHLLVPTISYLANTNLPTEPRDARSHSPIWNLKFTYHQPNTELLAARGGALPHAEYVQSRGLSCGCGGASTNPRAAAAGASSDVVSAVPPNDKEAGPFWDRPSCVGVWTTAVRQPVPPQPYPPRCPRPGQQMPCPQSARQL